MISGVENRIEVLLQKKKEKKKRGIQLDIYIKEVKY